MPSTMPTPPTGSTESPPAMETGRTPFPSDGLGAPIVSAPSTTSTPVHTSTSAQGSFGSTPAHGSAPSQGSFGSQVSFGSQGSFGSGSPNGSFGSAPPNGSAPSNGSVPAPVAMETRRSDTYYQTKGTIFGALIETIDLTQLAQLDAESGARRNPRHRQRNHLDQERRDVDRRAGRPARRHLQRRSRLSVRSSRCWRATTSPTSWSMAPTRSTSKSTARSRRPASASATTSSF